MRSPAPSLPPTLDAPPAAHETNLAQLFRNRAGRYGDAVRWRQRRGQEWTSATYRENQRLVSRLISGLDAIGARPGDAMGILSGTRWEWIVADWAIMGLGAFTTTLYPTLSSETVAFILRDSEARYLFLEDAKQYKKVAANRAQLPRLEKLVIFDDDPAALADPSVVSFSALLALGGRSDEDADAFAASRAREIQPDDLAGLIYTSGTTGRPKGVPHTHRMLVTQLACLRAMIPTLRPGMIDTHFLPLSHGMGRLEHLLTYEYGGETVIVPSLLHLAQDIQQAQPEALLGVPQVFERAQAAILKRVASAPKIQQTLFGWAMRQGQRAVPLRQDRRPLPPLLRLQLAIADRLVFRRLRAAFGGKVEFAVTGGAPADPAIISFFHAVGIPLLEGWGLTETTSSLSINSVDAFRIGSVGRIYPGHEVRIADDGEIVVRGPCIFTGYHNNPEASAEALDAEGWFHTGDIGTLDRDGFLSVIDRKKDLIVTVGGEKVAPQRLEALLDGIAVVGHSCVYGDRKPYVSALLTLDWEVLRDWASTRGLDASHARQLAQSPALRTYLDEQVRHVNGRLSTFEQIKRFSILTDDFTIDNGLLTPTQKIRRREVFARYQEQFDRLYQAAPSASPIPAPAGPEST